VFDRRVRSLSHLRGR